MVSVELVSSHAAVVGENPLWDVDERKQIYWIDVAGKKILRAAPDGRDVRDVGRTDGNRLDVPATGRRRRGSRWKTAFFLRF